MSDRLRVLSLSTLFPRRFGLGSGGFVARQFDAVHATGEIDLTVFVPMPRTAPAGDARAYPVHFVPFFAVHKWGWRSHPRAIVRAIGPAIRKLHANRPFDVVDAQFFWPDGPAAAEIARDLGLPLSIKARGSDIHFWSGRPYARARMLEAANDASGLLAVSAALKADMVAIGMGAAKIAVHYTGLDHALFHPRERAQVRAELDRILVPLEGKLLVCPGNLIALKGQALVIEALRHIPDSRVLFAGEGPDRRSLQKRAADRGLLDRVHFARLDRSEMATAMAAADAMVLPSEREGLANVWIEALASGSPIVITDVGGAREIVTGPAAGRLVAREPAAIAAAVCEVLAAPPAQRAVAACAAPFSWERNANELVAHWRRLASNQR